MFKLIKNEFLNTSQCWYEDECHNTAYFKRNENGNAFVAKLRFSNTNVAVEPLTITLPISENGIMLNYKDNCAEYVATTNDDLSSVNLGISNFTTLVNYWIGLVMATNVSALDFITEQLSEEEKEEANMKKLAVLNQYEELKGVISSIL